MTLEETNGRLIYDLGNGQWNIPELRILREEILPHNQVFTNYEVAHTFEEIGHCTMLLNGRRLDHMQLILLVIADITKRKHSEEALRQINETLESRVRERTEQVRRLITQLTMSEQEECRRISAVLHDDLQQLLYSVNFQLATLRRIVTSQEGEEARQIIDEIEETLDDSVKLPRTLSVDLSPPVFHRDGLFAALRWLAAQMEQQQQLAVSVVAEDGLPPLDDDLRVLLFQFVRELLFNVVKQAGVSTAVGRGLMPTSKATKIAKGYCASHNACNFLTVAFTLTHVQVKAHASLFMFRCAGRTVMRANGACTTCGGRQCYPHQIVGTLSGRAG